MLRGWGNDWIGLHLEGIVLNVECGGGMSRKEDTVECYHVRQAIAGWNAAAFEAFFSWRLVTVSTQRAAGIHHSHPMVQVEVSIVSD